MIVPQKFSALKTGPKRRWVGSDSFALSGPTMSVDDADAPHNPAALKYVGPATAAAIERAHFDADDIVQRTVSVTDLLAAGVNPGVAAKLRKEYSLVWAFRWHPGADLDRRAQQVGGLDPDHREWIAASALADGESLSNGGTVGEAAEQAWRERAAWLGTAAEKPFCGRCGGPLVTYRLGDRESVQCDGCGYVGLTARL